MARLSSPVSLECDEPGRHFRVRCLQLEEPLRPGESLVLHYTEGQLPACVRHCRHCEDTYFVCVEFTFNCAWSREVFEPASMLDPAIYAMS
jgi:hypothetical protein